MQGKLVGQYRLREELGTGGMGTVYLATVEGEALGLVRGDRIALKVVHPHLLSRPGFFKRFLREAEAGLRVRNANVVRTLDIDATELDGQTVHFIVMEYVEGRTLRRLLDDLTTVPEALLVEIGSQVAAGLAAVHGAGIVHRDIKPENVLISKDHRARIMDLGVARLVEESVELTKAGQFAGSLHYAAPEQFRAGAVGPAADLYSLGVLLYELATGENPFSRKEIGAVMNAHLEVDPPRVHLRNSEISRFFSEVVGTLLAKEPGRRFESAVFLRDVLLAGEGSTWWSTLSMSRTETSGRAPSVPVRRETSHHGREEELTILSEAFDTASGGVGGLCLVEGEAGIGKSRLMDAFVAKVRGPGVNVLYGSYSPGGGLGGLSDAILDHLGPTAVEEALAPYLTSTPGLVRAFAKLIRNESPPEESPPIRRESLHAVFCHLLRGLAREKPLVWIVEDLHFAEPDSRGILLSLARAARRERVLLIGTSRPGQPEDEVVHLSRLEGFQRIRLSRLGAREVIELLTEAFRGRALAEKLGGKIAYKSDGVPYFILEMVRGLRDGGHITEQPDGSFTESQAIGEIEVPSAVRELIQGRLAGVPRDLREILDLGSVQGYEFDPRLVARVQARPPIRVLQDLAALERRSGVVRGVASCYRFDHHQIQEVLYRDLHEGLRTEYHTALAEARAADMGPHSGPPEELPGETAHFLAQHHLKGSRPERAREILTGALRFLGRAYRNDAALDLADRALEIPGLLEGKERVEVLLEKADRYDLLGRREDQKRTLDEARSIVELLDDPGLHALVLRAVGMHLARTVKHEESMAALRESATLARTAGDKKLEALALSNIGGVYGNTHRLLESREHFELSSVLAGEAEDVGLQAGNAGNLGIISLLEGDYAGARESYERSLRLAEEANDRHIAGIATQRLGTLCQEQGRFEEGLDHYTRALAIFCEIGARDQEAVATGSLGTSFQALGRPGDALEKYEQCRVMFREIGDPHGEATANQNTGWILANFGALSRAAELFADCRSKGREVEDPILEADGAYGMAFAAHCSGEAEEAEGLYRGALSTFREVGYRYGVAHVLEDLGALLRESGRFDEAREMLVEGLGEARDLELPGVIVLTSCQLARLPGGDSSAAAAALAEQEALIRHVTVMRANYHLHAATGDPERLKTAHDHLEEFLSVVPEEYRTTAVENVPMNRKIRRAWSERERGGQLNPGT